DEVTVYPPVVYLRPCASVSLEITGHYEDGQARDLSEQPGVALAFGTGSAAQVGTNGVVLNLPADDTPIGSFDGADSAVVPIRVLAPDDLSLCSGATTTTTVPPSSSTTTTTMEPGATTTTSTAPAASSTTVTTTTAPASSTTSTTVPAACQGDTDCDD